MAVSARVYVGRPQYTRQSGDPQYRYRPKLLGYRVVFDLLLGLVSKGPTDLSILKQYQSIRPNLLCCEENHHTTTSERQAARRQFLKLGTCGAMTNTTLSCQDC